MERVLVAFFVLASSLGAGSSGRKVLYVGGTMAGISARSDARIEMIQDDVLRLSTKSTRIEIPYKEINTLEYGLRVNRRYLEAVFISPLFLAAKKRVHFLTIGYTDGQGLQQAMVLQVSKEEIRPLLVSLEA